MKKAPEGETGKSRGQEGVKKCWGQPAAAKSFTDKEGLETGRLWQSPIFSHLPGYDFFPCSPPWSEFRAQPDCRRAIRGRLPLERFRRTRI